MHPSLENGPRGIDELRRLLRTLASGQGVTYADAADLLSAGDFADALHPNESGRRKFSQFLGAELAKVPADLSSGASPKID